MLQRQESASAESEQYTNGGRLHRRHKGKKKTTPLNRKSKRGNARVKERPD